MTIRGLPVTLMSLCTCCSLCLEHPSLLKQHAAGPPSLGLDFARTLRGGSTGPGPRPALHEQTPRTSRSVSVSPQPPGAPDGSELAGLWGGQAEGPREPGTGQGGPEGGSSWTSRPLAKRGSWQAAVSREDMRFYHT